MTSSRGSADGGEGSIYLANQDIFKYKIGLVPATSPKVLRIVVHAHVVGRCRALYQYL